MSHDHRPMKSTADTMSHDQQPMKSSPIQRRTSVPQAKQTDSDLSVKHCDIHHTLTPHTLTPHTLTPHTLTPHTLTPHTLTLRSKLRGIVIALCCHHRCRWQHMVGREWLSGRGFSAVDFHLIAHMSSWAVCGVRSVGGEGRRGEEEVCLHKEEEGEEEEEGEGEGEREDAQGKTQSLHKKLDASHPVDTMATCNHGDTMATYKPSKTTATCNLDNPPANCNHGNTTTCCNHDSTMATSNYRDIATHSHGNITATCNRGNAMTTSPSFPPSYCPHPQEGVGVMCKRVLDLARLHWLREMGWGGRLVTFVPRATSLENVLLIATPPQPVM